MIAKLIRWSVANRFLVLLATAMLTAWGVWGVRSTPVDALPDLSDVQVIIRTNYPGQAPQIVENQVTYPLATTMLSVPGAKTVRGFSFFGDSFVYVLFEDGTDLYWARSRVLEYLNQVQGRLPATAKPALGPDATGVGWIFQYALVDRTGKNDLAQLRALQDWFLKFELKSLPNVAEVASVGGMVKQYQVVLDPIKLASYGLSQAQVRDALMRANQETGGSVLELSGAEYMVRASGYLKTLDEFREIPLTARGGVPVRLTGNDLGVIDRIAAEVEQVAKGIPGVTSSLAERLTGGRYVDVQIDRVAAGRYGLNIADVQAVIAGAVGGENVSETVEGLARFPINLRYAREWRDSPQRLAELPIFTPMGQQITLGTVARIAITDGPPMLKSENARPSGWVYVDVRGRDLASVANELRDAIGQQVKLEPGVSITYSGQFEYMERANARLKVVVPATLLIIFVLLYLTFARVDEAGLIMATLPFALTGGVWFLYLLNYNLSIATGVGFIALAGVAAEFGVVMLIYLKQALGMPSVAATSDAARPALTCRTASCLNSGVYFALVCFSFNSCSRPGILRVGAMHSRVQGQPQWVVSVQSAHLESLPGA